MSRVVIVGASVAGVATARALRDQGFAGDVVLLGDEAELPYDKPPLSKGLLAGVQSEADIRLLTEREAADARIELRLGVAATSLDLAAREVGLADGTALPYDIAVIATGARARPSPWGRPAGLHLLRTLDDLRALRAELVRGGRLVIVGGGFIGAEAAGTARSMGLDVQIVDPVPVPMGRVLGPELGAVVSGIHAEHGVRTRFGVGVTDVVPHDRETTPSGHPALEVQLSDGAALVADIVLVGIGALPNEEWLADSGLVVDNGVVCDEFCHAVGTTDVYAVGDVARWWHPRHAATVRVEHWTTATEQARAVATHIVAPDDAQPFRPVEYVWSDQYDWKFQIAGRTGSPNPLRIDDPADPRRFAALYSDDGERFSGALVANAPKALLAVRRAVDAAPPLAEVADDVRRVLGASGGSS